MEACDALGLSHHLLVNAAAYVNHDGTPAISAATEPDKTPKSDAPGITKAQALPPPPPPPPPAPPPATPAGITTIAPMKGRIGGQLAALMHITPITDKVPACFGVCCHQHRHCARYHAVDGLADSSHAIDSCEDGTSHPLFVQHQVEALEQ